MEEEETGGGSGTTGGLGGRDGKEAVRAHTLATSIVRHLAFLQNEMTPLRAPQQSARYH